MSAERPILEPSDLVLASAHVLHTNGQSTHETVQAAGRLDTQFGLRAGMIAHWDELELRAATDGTDTQSSFERGLRAGTCNQSYGPYESAWDGQALFLVFCATSKCGYRQSLYKDSSRIPTLH